MKRIRKSYYNNKWFDYAKQVKSRDKYQCLKCKRNSDVAVLQVHHKRYVKNWEPWEYPLSDCLTLCRGCHAREHSLIAPNIGWTLIAINDLGDLDGICQLKGCGREIRYEHDAYHPNWGYLSVGSSCIEFLTEEDKELSSEVLGVYKNISNFIHKSEWSKGQTKKGKDYIGTTYKHNILRIYGEEDKFAFQIAIKEKGKKWHEWQKSIPVNRKNIIQVKEMAYIVAKGLTTDKSAEKEILRNIYKQLK